LKGIAWENEAIAHKQYVRSGQMDELRIILPQFERDLKDFQKEFYSQIEATGIEYLYDNECFIVRNDWRDPLVITRNKIQRVIDANCGNIHKNILSRHIPEYPQSTFVFDLKRRKDEEEAGERQLFQNIRAEYAKSYEKKRIHGSINKRSSDSLSIRNEFEGEPGAGDGTNQYHEHRIPPALRVIDTATAAEAVEILRKAAVVVEHLDDMHLNV
jgi:hypothetical protein